MIPYRKETKTGKKSHTREPRGQPEGDHKAARNRQDRIIRNANDKNDRQKKHRQGKVSKKITEGVKYV